MAHVCRPPGVQPPGTVWACATCHLNYQYGPVAVSELGGRILHLWVRIGRPFWTPYGNPKAAPSEQAPTEPQQHVAVISGRKEGEFCGRCGLHWSDDCHIRSSAVQS